MISRDITNAIKIEDFMTLPTDEGEDQHSWARWDEQIRNPDFEKSYKNAERFVDLLMRRFKLNIDIDVSDDLLQKGDVLVFNHFSRFETLIPPYMLYKRIGVYSRTIATRELFELGRFSDFLCSVGSVPDNLKDLMLFLGIEILKGRKVVIFPEGSMIKDKRVVSDNGEIGIFDRTTKEMRKLHKGAAVLALSVDLLKKYIVGLTQVGRMKAFYDFMFRYGFEDAQALIARCEKKTVILPGNITFLPLRGRDNAISRLGQKFFNIKGRYLEEVIVETNLLFRDTDMHIRCYDPIVVGNLFSKFDRLAIKLHLRYIKSEEDLFKRSIDTVREKFFDRWFQSHVREVRDLYATRIYKGLTLNIYHIVCYYIVDFLKRDITEVSVSYFVTLIYCTIKKLAHGGHPYLHPFLRDPYQYGGLWGLWGAGYDYSRVQYHMIFEHEGHPLLHRHKDTFVFDKKILTYTDFSSIRLQNPVRVYANEVLPVQHVVKVFQYMLQKSDYMKSSELTDLYVSDELLAYQNDFAAFMNDKYLDINNKQTYTESGAPYLLRPKNSDKRIGIVLVHGFLASPAEVRPLADRLQQEGYTVFAPRLTGHGTSPYDLARCTYMDWLACVKRAVTLMRNEFDHVVAIGFSMGGALSCLHASRFGLLSGVISVAAPVFVRDKGLRFIGVLSRLQRALQVLPSVSGDDVVSFHKSEPENPHINYRDMPSYALNEFRKLLDCMKAETKSVTCPLHVMQGDADPIVDPKSASFIYQNAGSLDKELTWIKSNRHGILYHDDGDLYNKILNQLMRWHKGEDIPQPA